MISSIVLDLLLVIIVLMMVPLGFLRGGLREICTSAGLLFGILMAEQWAGRWAGKLADWFSMETAQATFLAAVLIVVLLTALVGYGGTAAFGGKPGPGGRIYGAVLALINALVVIGFLVNTYVSTVKAGQEPLAIEKSWVARALSHGFHWVLLIAAIGILLLTIFGMFVRERGGEEDVVFRPTADDVFKVEARNKMPETRPLDPAEETESEIPRKPVRIREVRHWEEEEETTQSPGAQSGQYGSGWRQTWPEAGTSKPWKERASQGTPPRQTSTARQTTIRPASSNRREVLREWMDDESSED